MAGAARMVCWGARAFIAFGICSGFGTRQSVQPRKRARTLPADFPAGTGTQATGCPAV